MIRAIAFKGGYVEGNTCAWLVYQVPEQQAFTSAKEALASFSHYLFHKFSLDYNKSDNVDDWNDFIFRIFVSTNDDYGYDESDQAQVACGASWNYYEYSFDLPIKEMIVIHERAENVLLCALRDNHNDLYSKFDDDDFVDGPNDIDLKSYQKLIE
jgi:hypothetical protein